MRRLRRQTKAPLYLTRRPTLSLLRACNSDIQLTPSIKAFQIQHLQHNLSATAVQSYTL